MPGGRLTTWERSYTLKALEYIESFYGPEDDEPNLNTQVVPTVCGLAIKLKVGRTTLYSWANNEETGFADILANINKLQESILINNGLRNNFNSNICKLMLGKHGYKEQQEHSGPDGKDLIPKVDSDLEAVRRIAFAFAKGMKVMDESDGE